MDTVTIKSSKGKIALIGLGAGVFVFACVLMILHADEQTRRNPLFLKIIGVIGILFFGIGLIYSVIKLFDNKSALIIDDKGITDNSSGVAVGFIAWQDITHISITQVRSTRFFLIYTVNPEKYLNDSNPFKSYMRKLGIKMYGTPLSISSSTLKYGFDELEKLLQSRLEQYKLENQ